MNIFIKSFNRPYLLDRCLQSIYLNVKGINSIIVLDDGTPDLYLDRIKETFPDIIIKKSEFHKEKSDMILSGQVLKNKLSFPGKFWHRECSSSRGEYFLLLEDDMYIVEKIDLNNLYKVMIDNRLQLFKLFWLGAKKLNFGKIVSNEGYELLYPKFPFTSSANFRRITQNKFGIFSHLERLGLKYYNTFILPFYSHYMVAGGIYSKEYFSYLWNNIDTLNEYTQVFRSLEYYEKNAIEFKIGKAKKESIKTTFLSSATNEMPNSNLSMFNFNHKMNEAWVEDKMNVMSGFPNGMSKLELSKFLTKEENIEWEKWIADFTNNFKNLGCDTNS